MAMPGEGLSETPIGAAEQIWALLKELEAGQRRALDDLEEARPSPLAPIDEHADFAHRAISLEQEGRVIKRVLEVVEGIAPPATEQPDSLQN